MSYLLDTDTISAYLREREPVVSRVMQYFGRLHASAITVGELYVWTLRRKTSPKRLVGLEKLLAGITVIPAEDTVARKFGELRAELLDEGRPTPTLDLWIAATAIVHGLTLVTHNVADFEQIPELTVIDWIVP
jgi:predicted nucleic acid-binding protein